MMLVVMVNIAIYSAMMLVVLGVTCLAIIGLSASSRFAIQQIALALNKVAHLYSNVLLSLNNTSREIIRTELWEQQTRDLVDRRNFYFLYEEDFVNQTKRLSSPSQKKHIDKKHIQERIK